MPTYLETVAVAGKIVAWGEDSYRQVSDVPPGDFWMVAPGGATQSLAIDENGALVLWGGVGATGIVPHLPGSSATSTVAPVVASPIRGEFIDAAIGPTHLVAVRRDGSIFHWGDYLDKTTVHFANTLRADAVTAAAACDVVVAIDGHLETSGAIGDPPAGTFTKVRARSDYVIALRADGRLFGWGGNLFKTLKDWKSDGDGHFYVDGPFKDLAAGVVQKEPAYPFLPHVLALHQDGSVIGWGTNKYGEAGAPPGGGVFQAIAAGLTYSLALDLNGEIHHWGNEWAGTGLVPGKTYGLGKTPKGHFRSISAASRHATAIRDRRIGVEPGPDAVTR